jgi:uncharacterized protein (DUF58 family)
VDSDELHERVRRLLFVSPALSTAFARGDYRSVFKGRGLDFDSLREYGEGDDARLIDWNVSVRLAKPYVRDYLEDRSLTLFLLIDVSESMAEGSGELSKRDMAVLAASLLAYAAQLRGMPVGGLIFAARPLRYFEPRRGKRHALALIDAAVGARPGGEGRPGPAGRGEYSPADFEGSDLAAALETPTRLLKRRSLVMAASDFRAAGWGRSLGLLARRHDTVALRLWDELDEELPGSGAFRVLDAEGGGGGFLALRSRSFHDRFRDWGRAERDRCERACVEARVPLLELGTGEDPARALLEFFDRRRRLGAGGRS